METKSRYEVISELEEKKRNLIRERDNIKNELEEKKKNLKLLEREKSDAMLLLDRRIEDSKEDITVFQEDMGERKETIKELIVGVEDSLARFAELQKKS